MGLRWMWWRDEINGIAVSVMDVTQWSERVAHGDCRQAMLEAVSKSHLLLTRVNDSQQMRSD